MSLYEVQPFLIIVNRFWRIVSYSQEKCSLVVYTISQMCFTKCFHFYILEALAFLLCITHDICGLQRKTSIIFTPVSFLRITFFYVKSAIVVTLHRIQFSKYSKEPMLSARVMIVVNSLFLMSYWIPNLALYHCLMLS